MLNVTIRQLRVFATVARHLNFARAAEELHLTAPAVSMQIRDLENVVGLPLFDRGGRKVSLTMTGEYFLVHARRMLGSLKNAEDLIARLRSTQTGRLVIGMLSTAQYFLPRLLAGFLKTHPGVEVNLTVGNRETLVESLHRNEVDLAVMGRPPKELDTRAEPFAIHPLGIVVAADHKLAQLPQVPVSMLANEPFIIREAGSGTRIAMESYFREHRIAPPRIMEMPSNETIKQAVIANMGLSFLSLHTVVLELQAGLLRVLNLEGLPLKRQWHLVHAHARTLSPPAEAFRYYVLESADAFLRKYYTPQDAARLTPDSPA
jgi:DNA-binding transcriptional LysR family regulator